MGFRHASYEISSNLAGSMGQEHFTAKQFAFALRQTKSVTVMAEIMLKLEHSEQVKHRLPKSLPTLVTLSTVTLEPYCA